MEYWSILYAWFCTSAMCGDTVWLEILMGEILVGNLFWRIDSFESNPPIFLSAIFSQYDVIITPSFKISARKLQTLKE